MSVLGIIGGGLAVIAGFAPLGIVLGKIVLGRFGRIAVVDRRDEKRWL